MRNIRSLELGNSSNRTVADGGIQPQSGPHGDKYASPNVISFRAQTPPLGSAADLERQLEAAPLFILDNDTCAICVLAVVVSSFAVAAGLLMFAGGAIFGLIDLG